jgi:hypothetical protein
VIPAFSYFHHPHNVRIFKKIVEKHGLRRSEERFPLSLPLYDNGRGGNLELFDFPTVRLLRNARKDS